MIVGYQCLTLLICDIDNNCFIKVQNKGVKNLAKNYQTQKLTLGKKLTRAGKQESSFTKVHWK